MLELVEEVEVVDPGVVGPEGGDRGPRVDPPARWARVGADGSFDPVWWCVAVWARFPFMYAGVAELDVVAVAVADWAASSGESAAVASWAGDVALAVGAAFLANVALDAVWCRSG